MSVTHYNLRARLAKGQPPFLFTWVSMAGAQTAGQIARLDFDGCCLDMQHGSMGFYEACQMIAAINQAQKPAIVRVLWNEPGLIGQALDAGAAAVIVPMISNSQQTRDLVAAAKYPPLGRRSWGGYSAMQASGLKAAEYLQQANQLTQIFAMIETPEALAQVEDIAATPGLDGLFVGPTDLSIALSQGRGANKTSTETMAAMQKIVQAAHKNGLVAGAFAGSGEVAKIYLKMGYSFIAAATDIELLQAGAKMTLQSFTEQAK